jgi:A/G-specific adenine glycosylase
MTVKERALIKKVQQHYAEHGRHDLPWRQTQDAYKILVSEVMLQQTQVDRVIPKYEVFMKRFPTVDTLAVAPLRDVLVLWQGLGYNRRAKALHECAKQVVERHKGVFPREEVLLRTLPGIGPYTARAVMAFAYGVALPLIETNVRTVYIHHFFPTATDVTDTELLPHIEATLDRGNPRDWYYALMDYGSYLKKTQGNNISKSKHFVRQSTFKGSDRQVRGAIVRYLGTVEQVSEAVLKKALASFDELKIDAQIEALLCEGMVIKIGRSYALPT